MNHVTHAKSPWHDLLLKTIATKGWDKKRFCLELGDHPDNPNSYPGRIYGGKLPEIAYAIKIFEALHSNETSPTIARIDVRCLKSWLLVWLESHFSLDVARSSFQLDEQCVTKALDAIGSLNENVPKPIHSDRTLPTLEYFPAAFHPLTVITGTGPEYPPERISDLFRANASLTDLLFLNELDLPNDTRIVSDRFVIDMEDDKRIEYFGKSHLLLIGGPKVNAVTRAHGKYGLFRFQVQNDDDYFCHLYDLVKERDRSHDLFQNEDGIKMFYELLEHPQLPPDDERFLDLVKDKERRKRIHDTSAEILNNLGGSEKFTHRDIVDNFNAIALVDPIHGRLLPASRDGNKEKAMITIAPNFYNRDVGRRASFKSCNHRFASVVVAGARTLGTAAALRMLGEDGAFSSHPLGGFFEVKPGNSSVDLERYMNAKCSWNEHLTPTYTIQTFIEQVENFKTAKQNPALQIIANHDGPKTKGIDNYLGFLREFLETASSK